jgi:hypothetical protein
MTPTGAFGVPFERGRGRQAAVGSTAVVAHAQVARR